MSTKMVFTAKIEDDNGNEIICPIDIESTIPDINEFVNGENFANNFHDMEKAILETRKTLSEKVLQEYLSESTKKKQVKK